MSSLTVMEGRPLEVEHLSSIPLLKYSLFTETELSEKVIKCKAVNLEKVVNLLTHPHSATLYERHEIALEKMLKYCKEGFLIKDSLNVTKLINVCAERSSVFPQVYLEPLIKMLQICSIPVLKEKSSDRLCYFTVYVDLMSQIGYAMRLDQNDVKLQVCKTINDLLTLDPPKSKYSELVYSDMEYTQTVIFESDISQVLAQVLVNLGSNLELKLAVLNLIQLITKSSETCCNKMLAVHGAHNLYTMASLDSATNVIFRAIDIFWNFFDSDNGEALNDQLCNKKFISWLRDTFISQLSKGYSESDRQIRNDLLIIITLVAQLNPEAPFVETGLVKQLTLLATFQEVKSHHPLVKNLKLSLNHEDFELKKLLINVLVILSSNKAVLPILEDGQFLLALFTCVLPLTNQSKSVSGQSNEREEKSSAMQLFQTQGINVWKPAYQEELQLHALSSLATLVPRMLNKFQDICGVNRLLIFVEWCIGEDMAFAGNGNGFHATGGKGNKLAQMRYCMRLILKIIQLNESEINEEFISEGCIPLFSEILNNVIKWGKSNSTIDLEIQCDMLFILATLCERYPHGKELFGSSGVSVLIGYLKMCYHVGKVSFSSEPTQIKIEEREENLEPAEVNGIRKLVIATVDAIWGCIIGCYFTEHKFLDQNGTFLMLDLLEVIPADLRQQILGCLVDLSENAKALSHLKTWRGKMLTSDTANVDIQTNIAHLLCRIWREEENRIDVPRGPYGTLGAEIGNPLLAATDSLTPVVSSDVDSAVADVEKCRENIAPPGFPSRTIVEISENVRANIYSLLSRVGYLDHPGLKVEDHVTLTIIESYLEFKMGEVWTEIQNELEFENIRPTSPDVEALEWISRSVEQEGVRVSKVQQELIDAKLIQDRLDEFEFYNQLRENHRQKEKNIQHFNEYVERTSNYEKLKEARQNQLANIEASKIAPVSNDSRLVEHTVGVHNIQVTKFCADVIQIDSTPVDIFGGKLKMMTKFRPKASFVNVENTDSEWYKF